MEWSILSKIDASAITNEWQQMDKSSFDKMVSSWETKIIDELPSEYVNLRNEVFAAYNETKKAVTSNKTYSKKKDYFTDLLFGIEFYKIMHSHRFSVRLASNDQIWMYLCVKVFPDIVHDRYTGTKANTPDGVIRSNINEERFWKTRRRIYLKVLWWYIYLSLQTKAGGSEDFKYTFEILKDNSTDEIVQIVERSGAAGYRVDVYREIMKYYSENRHRFDNDSFRKVMVLNTARTKVIEPALIDGGIPEYVKELFEYVR